MFGFDTCAEQTDRWFAELAGRGDGVGIEFRFVERNAAGDLASERGVFRITATPAAGEPRVL